MIKHLVYLTLGAGAVAGLAYAVYPELMIRYAAEAVAASHWLWDGIRANPVPAGFAAGTFLLTVVYHTARGKSLRESLEVAATRVTVVSVPQAATAAETSVVRRAKARATRAQLLADQIGLQTRQRKLPDDLVKAEKDACWTGQAVAEAERALAARQKARDEAVAKLEALRAERAAAATELAEIEAELRKLDAVV